LASSELLSSLDLPKETAALLEYKMVHELLNKPSIIPAKCYLSLTEGLLTEPEDRQCYMQRNTFMGTPWMSWMSTTCFIMMLLCSTSLVTQITTLESPGCFSFVPVMEMLRMTFLYVDDMHTRDFTTEHCWLVTRLVASLFNHLGIQDAPRKHRGPALEPGAWAGSIILHAGNGYVTVTVSIEHWLKATGSVEWIHDCIIQGHSLFYKTLESYRGFLVYISWTYPMLVPYFKGFHSTLASW
jgi:hypothetical protein